MGWFNTLKDFREMKKETSFVDFVEMASQLIVFAGWVLLFTFFKLQTDCTDTIATVIIAIGLTTLNWYFAVLYAKIKYRKRKTIGLLDIVFFIAVFVVLAVIFLLIKKQSLTDLVIAQFTIWPVGLLSAWLMPASNKE